MLNSMLYWVGKKDNVLESVGSEADGGVCVCSFPFLLLHNYTR